MIKLSNFCGIFATVFVTTTVVLLASCSQDDDNYDSDMYTMAEMGTRLGGGGEWHQNPSSPTQYLSPGSSNGSVHLDGLDVVFTFSWSDTIHMGDSVQITKISDESTIVIECKDENGQPLVVNKCEYVGHDIPSPTTTNYTLNSLSVLGTIYFRKAVVNSVTQKFEGWSNSSALVTVTANVGSYVIWK